MRLRWLLPHQQDMHKHLSAIASFAPKDVGSTAVKQKMQCQGCGLGKPVRELTGRMTCASCSSWPTVRGCNSSMLRKVLISAFPPRLLGATTVVNVLASS